MSWYTSFGIAIGIIVALLVIYNIAVVIKDEEYSEITIKGWAFRAIGLLAWWWMPWVLYLITLSVQWIPAPKFPPNMPDNDVTSFNPDGGITAPLLEKP